MSAYAIVAIPAFHHQINPLGPRLLWERGQREDDRLAAWQRYSFWHPDLPKVSGVHAYSAKEHADSILRKRYAETGDTRPVAWREMPGRRFNPTSGWITALFLSLLLPSGLLAQEPCKVNVNSASPAQLVLLIQTGPALAAKIEAARKDPKTGATVVLDAAKLDAVSGVGVKWLEYNGPYVAYDGPTTCETKLRKPATVKPEAGKDGAQ